MKLIEGWGNRYSITEDAKIWSCWGKKFLKPSLRGGYSSVWLYNKYQYKALMVHRLFAQAFLPNPSNLPCVNHIDGNKLNNVLTNLEWCTSTDNIKHAYRTGLKGKHKTI